MEKVWLLFHDVNSAMTLYQKLKEEKVPISIAPTPREASRCCGVCVLLENPDDETVAVDFAKEAGITLRGIHRSETDFNPKRDRYC